MTSLNLVESSNHEPLDVSQTNVTHATGTVFSESDAKVSVPSSDQKFFQNVDKFPLSEFLQRAVEIAHWDVSSADVPGVDVTAVDVWTNWRQNPAVAEKLKNYLYIRGTMQVIAVVTMPGAAYGRYVLTALPNGGPTSGTVVSEDLVFENCMVTDHHAQIDCAQSENVVFQLPFLWPYDLAALRVLEGGLPDNMWKLYLSCLVPLSTAVTGGSTSGYIRIYANLMDDMELTMPVLQAKQKLKPNAALKAYAPNVYDKIGEGKGSAIAGKLADIAEMSAKVPLISSFAGPAAGILRGAESVLDYFGFTRDNGETKPLTTVQRSVTNVAHVDGIDNSDTAALTIDNAISIDPTLAGGSPVDCTAYAELFSRWTLVASSAWTSDDAHGHEIYSLPVTPFYGRQPVGGALNGLILPVAGYTGLPFTYWRGDMEYLVVIPVSKLHRGSVQIYWNSSPLATTAEDVTNQAPNYIHDVSTGCDPTVYVGYARDRPYLDNTLLSYNTPALSWNLGANGQLKIRVINPLSSQTTSTSTTIFIFARAKNMDFQVPRDWFHYFDSTMQPMTTNIYNQVILQGGALGDDGDSEQCHATLIKSPGPFPATELYFGEQITSVRALLQKPSKIPYEDVDAVNGTFTIPLMYRFPGTGNVYPWTWQGYYAPMFTGIACSERVKLIPLSGCYVGAARSNLSTAPNVVSTLAPMTFTGANRGAEFNIPYYIPRKYHQTYTGGNEVVANPATLVQVRPNAVDGSTRVQPYYSFGPDIRVTCFRQTPMLAFKDTEPAGLTPWMT